MGLFNIFKKKESSFEDFYQTLEKRQYSWLLDPEMESELLKWDDEEKILLFSDIIAYDQFLNKDHRKNGTRLYTFQLIVALLARRKIQYEKHALDLLQSILEALKNVNDKSKTNKKVGGYDFYNVIKPILSNMLRFHKFENEEEILIIDKIKSELENFELHYYNKEIKKLIQKIEEVTFESNPETDSLVKPSYFIGEDEFTAKGNAVIDKWDDPQKQVCFQLIAKAQKASGGKPSKKYLDESKVLVEAFGNENFKLFSQELFEQVIDQKEKVTTHTHTYDGHVYEHNSYEFLDALNAEVLKGLVWMNSKFHDGKTITTISNLAERCFKKIPGKGPAAAGLGNACLYTLFASKGLDGIAQLSKLKLKIKQNSTLKIIDKYIDEAARKLGISPSEVEDLAVDDFKLQDNKIEVLFGEIKAVLELTGIGKSVIKWYKEDGKEQKTIPKVVKDKYSDKLKKLKAKQKQINQATSVQKERFDRMLRMNRVLTLDYFNEKYVNHALLSFVINKVIFKFSNDQESKLALKINDKWFDNKNQEVNIDTYSQVELWHPVTSSTQEVKDWRQFLMDNEIQQPFKQAYREIYLLTDAEINTRTYSNRMASHILKQHQFVTLAKGRNWNAKLMGAWDGGEEDITQLHLPEYNLIAEYWINALNDQDLWNDMGIWNYVTTDQVRFLNSETKELIELIDVPIVAFSEVMRDVDLFVGVASVGNDPTWSDSGGLPTYRNYWQSYSFGDLSEVAKNRKEILQNLIPRLKIANAAHISDRFLIVKGKLRTYKIHLGSTNILMEPNDQYLCIVQDRSKNFNTDKVFLPFEGDIGLSVIISKALLLADDDKITDTTITSQIKR